MGSFTAERAVDVPHVLHTHIYTHTKPVFTSPYTRVLSDRVIFNSLALHRNKYEATREFYPWWLIINCFRRRFYTQKVNMKSKEVELTNLQMLKMWLVGVFTDCSPCRWYNGINFLSFFTTVGSGVQTHIIQLGHSHDHIHILALLCRTVSFSLVN